MSPAIFRRRPTARLTGILLAALVVAPPVGAAQDRSAGAGLDSLIALVPVRDRAGIEGDLRRAQEEQTASGAAIDAATTLRARAEGRRKLMEIEIDAIKQRISLAKKEKREVDQRSLEIERDAAELGKKLLEEREALRKAELELAEARRERAAAAARAARTELELHERRVERERTGGQIGGIGAGRLDRVVQELEGTTLQAFRDLARRDRDLANRSLQVVERQLKLHEAQTKLSTGA